MTKSIVFTRMTATEGESSEPLGICYIASYLREKGFDVNIVDREKNIVEKIKKLNPDFVGISSTTLSYWKAIEIAKELKIELPDTKIIIGGNHITALPMKMPDCFDIGVVGEGEITTLEILQGKDINKIKGIVFRKNNNLVMTGPRPLIENLDILPFPARDLLPMKFYLEPKKMSGRIAKVLYVMTSRGCPYDCKFCSSADMWHSKV